MNCVRALLFPHLYNADYYIETAQAHTICIRAAQLTPDMQMLNQKPSFPPMRWDMEN